MANVKITELPAAGSVTLDDVVPVVDLAGPTTQKATLTVVRAALMPAVLTADVSGILPAANGGTGASSLPAGGLAGITAMVAGDAASVATAAADATAKANAAIVAAVAHADGLFPVDLATGDVTGILPKANQGAQDMAGDVTGSTAASVVAKVKGTTITTAGGALAVGAVLRTTAVGTADWGAVDLADADAVTGILPAANVAQATGTGIPHVVAGVLSAASSLIVNADVHASAAIAASKVVQATGTGIPHVVAGALSAASSLIVNADVDAAAAIAASKVVQATGTGIPHVVAGVLSAASSLIVNADVSASAAIAASKVVQATGTGIPHVVAGALSAASSLIVDADVSASAAIAGSKLVAATTSVPGSMSAADKTKLDGLQRQGTALAIGALSIDWSTGTTFAKTLSAGGNTFTFANMSSGMCIMVVLTGAASTVTWPTVKWAGGVAPTQTASGIDVYTFLNVSGTVYGSVVQAMA